MTQTPSLIGVSVPRSGLEAKVRGLAPYTADLHLPGMLYGRVLRSPHPHARILSIDPSRALALPGVHAVVTHADFTAGRIDADLAPLDTVVRFVGDEVAAVAADSESLAEDALSLIEVQYELLQPVFDAGDALAPGAPQLHASGNLVGGAVLEVERGSVRNGFDAAARVFEGRFHTQMHGPVGMETRAALAEWQGDNVTVWKTSRAVHAVDRQSLARVLGIPAENVRVVCTTMGGGFGNKDEGRLASLTALLARKAGLPVRIEYSRVEEFVAGRNRQETDIELRIGIAADGGPVAIDMDATMNAGAYVASGMGVTRRIGQGALYLYTCDNARFAGRTAYTNRPAGGSFRGLGAPLGHFALEVTIDQIAHAIGVDPLDYRIEHHVRREGQPGQRTTPLTELAPDQPVEGGIPFSSNSLRACIVEGAERIGWRERRHPTPVDKNVMPQAVVRGIGMALGNYKGGGNVTAQAGVTIAPSGNVQVAIGIVDVGQGSETILAQIVAETLGAPLDAVEVVTADTAVTPPAHVTAGSSTTMTSGTAVKQAAEEARRQLLERSGASGDWLSLTRGLAEPVRGDASVQSGSTEAIINSFAAHFAEVEVDTLTGRIRVLRYVAAHDSGRIINPRMAQNQVSGGVLQFLGIALREELLIDKHSGVTLNPGFLEHKSTAIVDFPAIEALFCGEPDPIGPYGAKALGEPPVVPVFAAISNAFANATGVWLHEVPFTPARVLAALKHRGDS
ncbi:MAG TPA: molybdopterin cofactor-binding domain-containing protein [Dehalococcoidia bacterium]|nr:molybdopterin cofactor-binding domain-containing protein [Dehalococcoidia bacterium]